MNKDGLARMAFGAHGNVGSEFYRRLALVGLAAALWISPAANAQSIPPACDQFFKAMEACGDAAVRYKELTSPAEAKALKETLAGLPSLKATVRDAVQTDGEVAVAEKCLSTDFKRNMMNFITASIMMLSVNKSMTPQCTHAANAIRLTP